MFLLSLAANGSAEFQFRDIDTKRLTLGAPPDTPMLFLARIAAPVSGTRGADPSDKLMIEMLLFAVHSSVCGGTRIVRNAVAWAGKTTSKIISEKGNR
jgi:hypothetical protein